MNRLTIRNEKGDLLLCGEHVYGNNQAVYNAVSLLEAYEDTEMISEDIIKMHENYIELQRNFQKVMIELEKYRDLEEQGLLIKLPCKVDEKTKEQILFFCSNDSNFK